MFDGVGVGEIDTSCTGHDRWRQRRRRMADGMSWFCSGNLEVWWWLSEKKTNHHMICRTRIKLRVRVLACAFTLEYNPKYLVPSTIAMDDTANKNCTQYCITLSQYDALKIPPNPQGCICTRLDLELIFVSDELDVNLKVSATSV